MWVWWDKDLTNVPLKDAIMERVRVEEFGESKEWRLWMSQSCFSQEFFSRNSLWKLSTFRGYKGIYSRVCIEYEESVITKQGVLSTRARDWNKSQANCLARLEVFSCSTTVSMTLQLPYMLHTCAISSDSPVARSSREALLECTLLSFSSHYWVFLHTFSHTTLTWFPPKYRVSKCWIISKFDTE